MFKNWLFKLSLLIIILTIPFIGGTKASLLNSQNSDTNSISAGVLDLSLTDTFNNPLSSPLFNLASFNPGDTDTKDIKVKKENGLDFKYQISAIQTSGDTDLCNALQIEAKLAGVSQYSGSLTGLTIGSNTISGAEDIWVFILSLNDSAESLRNKTCNFDLRFRAWQTNSDGNWGLSDDETVSNAVTSGNWAVPETVTVRLFPVADTQFDQAYPSATPSSELKPRESDSQSNNSLAEQVEVATNSSNIASVSSILLSDTLNDTVSTGNTTPTLTITPSPTPIITPAPILQPSTSPAPELNPIPSVTPEPLPAQTNQETITPTPIEETHD